MQSLQSDRHLSDTWKVVLVSKCTQGQSFSILYAICIESFCYRILTAISHNVFLTLYFWIGNNFFQFQDLVPIPISFFLFLYICFYYPDITSRES